MEMYDSPECSPIVAAIEQGKADTLAAFDAGRSFTFDEVYERVEWLTADVVEQNLRELVAAGEVRVDGANAWRLAPPRRRPNDRYVIRAIKWVAESVSA